MSEKIDILAFLLSKPDEFLKERIKDRSVVEMLKTAFPNFYFDEFDDEFLENLYNNIDSEYLYLFVGVSKPLASPYVSSYYREKSHLMDEPAKNVIAIMKKWGIKPYDSYKDLPDHIVSILALLSILENHLGDVEEPELKAEIKKDIDSIVRELDFLDRFLENIKREEKTGFYSKIVEILIETIGEMK